MGNGADLFRAILDRPDDDDLRLVYADWLEESDTDPARAEFIRCQVNSRRLNAFVDEWTGTHGRAEDAGRAGASLAEAQHLEERAKVLLLDNWVEWARPVFEHLGLWVPGQRGSPDRFVSTELAVDITWEWHGGFVGVLKCRCDDLRGRARLLASVTPITSVVLKDRQAEPVRMWRNRWFRHWYRFVAGMAGNLSELPWDLFHCLAPIDKPVDRKQFSSNVLASVRLADACVLYLRRQAGLAD